jgi:hypothetical protein
MSYDLTNDLLGKGTPCHWSAPQVLIYMILASRYQNETKRAYPGLEGFTRVTNLQRSAIQKHISQLKKEGWVIQIKRGQTGQRAEYSVVFKEEDLNRCQSITPCHKHGSNPVTESVDYDRKEHPQNGSSATNLLHPKRITNLTNKTNNRFDKSRFDFVVSKIPSTQREQIGNGTNIEELLDNLIEIGVTVSEICDHLGRQTWDNSTTPGGLLQTILRRFLFDMSARERSNKKDYKSSESLSNNEKLQNEIASLSQGFKLPK